MSGARWIEQCRYKSRAFVHYRLCGGDPLCGGEPDSDARPRKVTVGRHPATKKSGARHPKAGQLRGLSSHVCQACSAIASQERYEIQVKG